MNDERVIEEIVTTFLLNTCRLKLSEHAIHAAGLCGHVAADHLYDGEVDAIPLITGSVAEFYIEPMIPHR